MAFPLKDDLLNNPVKEKPVLRVAAVVQGKKEAMLENVKPKLIVGLAETYFAILSSLTVAPRVEKGSICLLS